MANDELVKLLYYSDKDPLSNAALTEEQKQKEVFEKLIKVVPRVGPKETAQSILVVTVLKGNSNSENSEFRNVQIRVEVFVPLTGRFNVYNLLGIYGAAMAMGFDRDETLRILSALTPVNGRFETIPSPKGWTAIVDYAHTPDALTNVLNTINDIRKKDTQLITVVGCGGNRDKGKRPMMAHEAVVGSTRVVLTSDNPRDEEPQDILNDMLAGLTEEEKQRALVISDRHEAIKVACMLAQRGDVILIAGKGHEDYQIIKGVKHHFDDKEEVRKYIE
jgi:UDP-N-acetylmuramoyl-L-alanyl-D-glutamate--2,6-diaminopimelate ligase